MPSRVRSFIDTVKAEKKVEMVKRQMPFIIASTLTAVAKDGQAAGVNEIKFSFDKPTPFTQRGVAITPARKTNLIAQVFVKDRQAEYLARQETGGVRSTTTGERIQPPVQIRTNVFGNIPRGAIKREIAKPRTFTVGRAESRRSGLPPGIYQRPAKRGRGGKRTRMLVAFHQRAAYTPRFGFKKAVSRAAQKNLKRRWEQSMARALATARK